MEYIPIETKCHILSNLCSKDCGIIACVNKDLRTLSGSDYIWKRFIPKSSKVKDNYKSYIVNIYNNYKDKCNVSLPHITKYILLSFLTLTFITILQENICFDTEYTITHHIRNYIYKYINFIELCATFIRDRTQDPVILSMNKHNLVLCTYTDSCPTIYETQTNLLGLSSLFILYVISYMMISILYILLLITHKIFIYKILLSSYNLVVFLTIYSIIRKFVIYKKQYKDFIEIRKRIHNMM